MILKTFCAIVLLISAGVPTASAQPMETDALLNESVQTIPQKGFFTLEFETTVYKPDGEGPFPIAAINHGKSPDNPHFQARYRPALAARYFLQRGYAVVVPMRQAMPAPPTTDFAPVDDESKLPFVRDAGRAAYKMYLAKPIPLAFAIAPNGAWGWADGCDDPLKRALLNCNRKRNSGCKLYSADDFVVWNEE